MARRRSSSDSWLLVADACSDVRPALETLFFYGSQVVLFSRDGTETVELYRKYQAQIALVLVEFDLPDWGGPGTVEALRRIDPSVRCCYLIDDHFPVLRQNLFDPNSIHLLRKPVKGAELQLILTGQYPGRNDSPTLAARRYFE